MRILALDLGEKRIGVAAAEDETRVAIPIATLDVAGDAVESIAKLVEEQHANEVVVGLPLSMSGAIGAQAQHVMSIVDALEKRLAIPVHTWDERLTTVQAGKAMGPRRRGKERRSAGPGKDAVAAALLLQAYLDGRGS